jgi:hypothetical protein
VSECAISLTCFRTEWFDQRAPLDHCAKKMTDEGKKVGGLSMRTVTGVEVGLVGKIEGQREHRRRKLNRRGSARRVETAILLPETST